MLLVATISLAAGGTRSTAAESPRHGAALHGAPLAAAVAPTTVTPPRPVTFPGPQMAPVPADGRGRLVIAFDGNRRWCTAPDDRVLRPLLARAPRGRDRRDEVFTFGYQFTIAAIRRGRPAEPIMLYESPVIRTASWRLAAKLPRASRSESPGPSIGGEGINAPPSPGDSPASLVPYWDEQYRCATVGDRFEFDLDPGVYDVYMAFDLLLKDGSWVHRSSGHLTNVPVEGGRQTALDGRIHSTSNQNRDVEFLKTALLPSEPSPEPAHP